MRPECFVHIIKMSTKKEIIVVGPVFIGISGFTRRLGGGGYLSRWFKILLGSCLLLRIHHQWVTRIPTSLARSQNIIVPRKPSQNGCGTVVAYDFRSLASVAFIFQILASPALISQILASVAVIFQMVMLVGLIFQTFASVAYISQIFYARDLYFQNVGVSGFWFLVLASEW